jgi:hypothetical protein
VIELPPRSQEPEGFKRIQKGLKNHKNQNLKDLKDLKNID